MKTESNTKEKIISAAYQVLSEKGYDAASTKEIAACAGVAQGLINYYFPSKDDLFLAVLQAEGSQFCAMTQSIIEQEGPVSPEQVAAVAKLQLRQAPLFYRLRLEMYALGLRNEKLHAAVQNQLARSRQEIQLILSRLSGRSPEGLATLAAILLAAIEGLALQKLADPNFDVDAAYDEAICLINRQIHQN